MFNITYEYDIFNGIFTETLNIRKRDLIKGLNTNSQIKVYSVTDRSTKLMDKEFLLKFKEIKVFIEQNYPEQLI